MTTLVLQTAGALAADVAGRAVSTLVGGALQGALGGGGRGTVRMAEGPRLTEMAGLASTEGAPIPRIYGRARVGGELIWATRFEEVANTTAERAQTRGGKGGVFGGVLAAPGAGQGRRPSRPPIPTTPISRSGCARGRSRSCAVCGPTGRNSTSPC
jgi:hypothetical protein